MGAVGDGVVAVVQFGFPRHGGGHILEPAVDFEHFGAVDALRVFRRRRAALRDVTRAEVRGDLARVELVLQRDLHRVPGEGHGGDGCDFGIDAGDARDPFCGCQ